ncbi:MAG: hypothetical protein R2788_01290 [Saprospiraceae bacterium]
MASTKSNFTYPSTSSVIALHQTTSHQIDQEVSDGVKELSIRGSENPNLMPENAVTVRFHSVGGWVW